MNVMKSNMQNNQSETISTKPKNVKHTLSIVILTHNSANKIRECLESVKWADDIVVLDDCSTDSTVQIAKEYTDRVEVRRWDVEGGHRNYAYSLAKGDYLLSLDDDERVSEVLRDDLFKLMENGFEYDSYSVPYKNYMGEHWLRYGGWYPSPKLRIMKNRLPIFEETEPHPRNILGGESSFLKGEIIHHVYENCHHMVAKINYQTSMEAKKWVEDKRKMSGFRCFRKALLRFFKGYIQKKGFKDGSRGMAVALGGTVYQILTYFKYLELKSKNQ